MLNKELKGRIFNIQRFTLHDGPGIRTEIFLKGCPLNCLWCSNPEGLSPKLQLGIYKDKCIGHDKCALCLNACPSYVSPLHFVDGAVASISRSSCPDSCAACAEACPASAVIQWGKDYTVGQLVDIVIADRGLYQKSGGGVTLSGGEVMLQWEFAAELLAACKKNYIHTCVESTLYCDSEHMRAVYEYTDLVITDIKHMDTRLHKQFTGAGNEVILGNIKATAAMNKKLVVRIPIIPGYNDDDANILATGEFIQNHLSTCLIQLQLLPYRKMGTDKYNSLEIDYPLGNEYIPPEREVWESNLLRLTGVLCDMGLPAVAGGSVKYDA